MDGSIDFVPPSFWSWVWWPTGGWAKQRPMLSSYFRNFVFFKGISTTQTIHVWTFVVSWLRARTFKRSQHLLQLLLCCAALKLNMRIQEKQMKDTQQMSNAKKPGCLVYTGEWDTTQLYYPGGTILYNKCLWLLDLWLFLVWFWVQKVIGN